MAPERAVGFEQIAPHVGPFLEALRTVREVNSSAGDILDYAAEPGLKVIAVGGNRLSRGLTLEGLLVSYFVRRTAMYDTLMQMGRWFGYRSGYADLTRIHTTGDLRTWFYDLATVEHQLREDIAAYERARVTPAELGPRILKHHTMLVTSRLKQRHAGSIRVQQTYAGSVVQTFKFPFDRPAELVAQADANLGLTRGLLAACGAPRAWEERGPVWSGVGSELVLDFLRRFQVDDIVRTVSLPLLAAYVARQMEQDELVRWTVAIMGRRNADPQLGPEGVAWGVEGGRIHPIARTRLIQAQGDPNSVGVVTEPGDELAGFTREQREEVGRVSEERRLDENPAARWVRPAEEGLLLLYPISRRSDVRLGTSTRQRLFADPEGPQARDLIALALSFPHSAKAATIFGQGTRDFVTGTVEWRAVE